jgi:hypothetical protein
MWYFQHMLKLQLSVKEIEKKAADALQALLAEIPALKLKILKTESAAVDSGIDLTARLEVSGHPEESADSLRAFFSWEQPCRQRQDGLFSCGVSVDGVEQRSCERDVVR